GNDDPGHASPGGIRREAGDAARVSQKWIRVSHQEHGRVALAHDRRCLRDAVSEADPLTKSDLAGALHRRAVGERVAERHAELQQIRAPIEGGAQQSSGRRAVRVADGEIDDDGEALFFASSSESPSDARRPGQGRRQRHRISPALPPTIDAACLPLATPSPPASTPTILTPGSSRNALKMPIAFDPPPTQAITTSGSPPRIASACSRASRPMTAWKSRTIAGYGCGPIADPSR